MSLEMISRRARETHNLYKTTFLNKTCYYFERNFSRNKLQDFVPSFVPLQIGCQVAPQNYYKPAPGLGMSLGQYHPRMGVSDVLLTQIPLLYLESLVFDAIRGQSSYNEQRLDQLV